MMFSIAGIIVLLAAVASDPVGAVPVPDSACSRAALSQTRAASSAPR